MTLQMRLINIFFVLASLQMQVFFSIKWRISESNR